MPTVKPQSWQLNPLCNVIVGFRNYVFTETRSKYVSFTIKDQPSMCNLLLKLATTHLSEADIEQFPEYLFDQLVNYGLFKPIQNLAPKERMRNRFNLINENRNTVIHYKNIDYMVTSFIFMAFYSQKPEQFVRETAILPHYWSQKFAKTVFHLINQGITPNYLDQLSPHIMKRLIKHGVLVDSENCPQIDGFFARECIISKGLLQTIPPFSRALLPTTALSENLTIYNKIYFPENSTIPDKLISKIHNPPWVTKNLPTIWIEDIITQMVSMYWLEKNQETLLRQLIAGKIQSSNLDSESRELFIHLSILESKENFEKRRTEWDEKLANARNQIATRQCLTLHDILHPFQLAMARKYLKYMMINKYLIPDKANGATRKRYWQHRDDVTFYLQTQICSVLNQILPSPVKIGHNALSVYQPGAVLPKHKDDVLAFSWVMSLAIDTEPFHDREEAWPIYVETDTNQKECALLRMGDGHLINPQMAHWREQLQNHSLGILFLWFVPLDFRGYVNGNWIS